MRAESWTQHKKLETQEQETKQIISPCSQRVKPCAWACDSDGASGASLGIDAKLSAETEGHAGKLSRISFLAPIVSAPVGLVALLLATPSIKST